MEEKRYVKTEVPGLLRDETTGALINTNDHQYEQILAQRKKAKETKSLEMRLADAEARIKVLEDIVKGLLFK